MTSKQTISASMWIRTLIYRFSYCCCCRGYYFTRKAIPTNSTWKCTTQKYHTTDTV